MGLSPAAILYASATQVIKSIEDGSDWLLGVASKLRNTSGALVNPATEDTLATRASQTTTAAIETLLTAIKNTDGIKNVAQWLGSTAPTVGQKTMGNSLPVAVASNQTPIPVYTSLPLENLLSKSISFYYSQSIGTIVSGQWRRAATYVVPLGYSGYLIRFLSFQAEATFSRIVTEMSMGTLNLVTNTYVAGTPYTEPQWSGVVECEVTQAVGAANNLTVTVTYTNQDGVAGRTGTIAIPKSSIIGTRLPVILQSGDLGIRAITNLSTSPTSSSGAIKLLGFIQLAYHEDGGTAAMESIYAPGAVSFPPETVLGVEHQGGTVAKARRFDALLQLVEVV